jgi:hypothetical protein
VMMLEPGATLWAKLSYAAGSESFFSIS